MSEVTHDSKGTHDERVVILGGASGAWGDTSFAAPQLLDSGRCDYIFFEALAEITMGILTRARERDPTLGYATDVVGMIGRDLSRFVEQGGARRDERRWGEPESRRRGASEHGGPGGHPDTHRLDRR